MDIQAFSDELIHYGRQERMQDLAILPSGTQMEVGERRKAQLGAVSYPLGDQLQRLRISTVGDYQGRESLVMRFLYPLTQEHLRFFLQKTSSRSNRQPNKEGCICFLAPLAQGNRPSCIN